jgi:hypothetical protein
MKGRTASTSTYFTNPLAYFDDRDTSALSYIVCYVVCWISSVYTNLFTVQKI